MDLNRPENHDVQQKFEIQGFPTLIYFEDGKLKFRYGGEMTKDGLIKWMQNPTPMKETADGETGNEEPKWSDEETDVVHLTDATFASFIAEHPSVLIMFYAPWCGYCKRMVGDYFDFIRTICLLCVQKPDYIATAARLKEQNAGLDAVLAAVDSTENKALSTQYNIQGFPTVKYFQRGVFAWDFTGRTADDIYNFMIKYVQFYIYIYIRICTVFSPVEPPPPPPPEAPWKEEKGDVVHLNAESFRTELRKKKHALIMFYAPCKYHIL